MRLSELLNYDKIVIQCHDNPDPDSIASGYALYVYFKQFNKDVQLVYSGKLKITKPNILMMIEALCIPINYVQEMEIEGLLITVDCQYGAGNITEFRAKHSVAIDHHIQEKVSKSQCIIRSELASTATLVWQMLSEEQFDVNQYEFVATALYYGLFTDSAGFSGVYHELDRKMQDSLIYDKDLVIKLKHSIITLKELQIAGMALMCHFYDAASRCVIVKAQECDPNILGIISDFSLQVDCVDSVIVYSEVQELIKYSVRSCVKYIKANEIAIYLSTGIGNGGGHMDKAAGFISKALYNKKYEGLSLEQYFLSSMTAYYRSYIKNRI